MKFHQCFLCNFARTRILPHAVHIRPDPYSAKAVQINIATSGSALLVCTVACSSQSSTQGSAYCLYLRHVYPTFILFKYHGRYFDL